jgi:protein gp37
VFESHDTIIDENSWNVIEQARMDLWELIAECSNLNFLLLTKRPENVMDMLPDEWTEPICLPDNIWIGTSVGNQDAADKRIPHLLKVPAKVRFLSCEPLIGPVDLSLWFNNRYHGHREFMSIDWVIVGGESGHGARPMHPFMALSLRDQCMRADVPFFFKQWGEWMPTTETQAREANEIVVNPDGKEMVMTSNPNACVMRKVGKHAAGRLLDGKEYSEYPQLTY